MNGPTRERDERAPLPREAPSSSPRTDAHWDGTIIPALPSSPTDSALSACRAASSAVGSSRAAALRAAASPVAASPVAAGERRPRVKPSSRRERQAFPWKAAALCCAAVGAGIGVSWREWVGGWTAFAPLAAVSPVDRAAGRDATERAAESSATRTASSPAGSAVTALRVFSAAVSAPAESGSEGAAWRPPADPSFRFPVARASREAALPTARAEAQTLAPPLRLPPARLSLPAEYEEQAAIVLGCGELVECYPDMLAQLVQALKGRVALLALVPDDACREKVRSVLAARGQSDDAVEFVSVPHNTMWTRDYGPFIVRQPNGEPAMTDLIYVGADRRKDDLVPWWLGKNYSLPVVHVPLTLEGGNLLGNGRGLCLTTTKTLLKNRERGLDDDEILRLLDQYFGAEQTVVLEPLQRESTGHVDMFAVFVDADTVLVGRYDASIDPQNAAILDRNAARLASVHFAGRPLEVVRVPMPSNADGKFRTYTNAVFANGVLLLPRYGDLDPEGLHAALAAYRRFLPDWKCITIDATKVIEMGGALHCMTLNLAALPAPPLAPAASRAPLPARRSSRRG